MAFVSLMGQKKMNLKNSKVMVNNPKGNILTLSFHLGEKENGEN